MRLPLEQRAHGSSADGRLRLGGREDDPHAYVHGKYAGMDILVADWKRDRRGIPPRLPRLPAYCYVTGDPGDDAKQYYE